MKTETISYSPADLGPADIRMSLAVIADGEAVDLESATIELPQAVVIAICRDGQDIVGAAAIKRVRPGCSSRVAAKSGFRFNKNIHELGYVAVKESHRGKGLSYEISTKLLSSFKDRPIFATTSHEGMKRTLRKAGFVQQGNEWSGTKGNLLSLWIKDS